VHQPQQKLGRLIQKHLQIEQNSKIYAIIIIIINENLLIKSQLIWERYFHCINAWHNFAFSKPSFCLLCGPQTHSYHNPGILSHCPDIPHMRLPWVTRTPFGRPVDPLVYITIAMSSLVGLVMGDNTENRKHNKRFVPVLCQGPKCC
jgi:hypothetical protein